ncbi:MAG: sulfotransferase family protein, partial [Anaerolineae bacterium]
PEDMYEACRVFSQYVTWHGGLVWDWDAARESEIPQAFIDLIQSYLRTVLQSSAEHKGWKIPETTLVYPWIQRLFPDAKYIHWIRNPRDSILGRHVTDDLGQFGIPYPPTEDERRRRAISWKYQYDLMQATPKPAHWIEVRFEDFVLHRDEQLARLEAFLGLELARIPVKSEAVGRWRSDTGTTYYDFLAPAMAQYGYEIPSDAQAEEEELLKRA